MQMHKLIKSMFSVDRSDRNIPSPLARHGGLSYLRETFSALWTNHTRSQIGKERRLGSCDSVSGEWSCAVSSRKKSGLSASIPCRSIIASALGSVGTAESLVIAREVLLVDSPDHLDDLLFGIAQSSSNNEKWHKQLMVTKKNRTVLIVMLFSTG